MEMHGYDSLYTDYAWTFLTHHAYVLICLYQNPEIRLREVADRVGITERAVQSIVHDLEVAGVLSRERLGRRNRYHIHSRKPLRHPAASMCNLQDLLELFQLAEAAAR